MKHAWTIIYYLLAISLAVSIYIYSHKADFFYQSAVSKLDFATQSEVAWKSLLESLSLNLYQGAAEIQDDIALLNHQARESKKMAIILSGIFAVISLAYFYCLFRWNNNTLWINRNLVYVAFICFLLGISTTMLNLIAFRDLPVLGKVIFKYDAKTILSVVESLWINQKYFIFILLSMFSVFIPLIKLLSMLYVMVSSNNKKRSKILWFSDIIGKWSMTDVFVVAVLLSVFSLNADKTTDAWLGQGLYFFAIYGVLSVVVGQRVSNYYKDKKITG